MGEGQVLPEDRARPRSGSWSSCSATPTPEAEGTLSISSRNAAQATVQFLGTYTRSRCRFLDDHKVEVKDIGKDNATLFDWSLAGDTLTFSSDDVASRIRMTWRRSD